jgi:hypothetical protein
MNSRATSRGPATFACTLALVFSVTGCGRTLVFGERDGLNFAIRADSASQPPLEVNFGLDRTVGTIIPPAAQVDGRPVGEVVNMFAGFQIDRDDTGTPTPLGVKLRVATQFASGAAAVSIAGKPEVVNQIVSVGDRPHAGPTPAVIDAEVRAYGRALANLAPEQKRKLAEDLGLLSPSESVSNDMIAKRLRDHLDAVRQNVDSFNEFKQAFDRSTGS